MHGRKAWAQTCEEQQSQDELQLEKLSKRPRCEERRSWSHSKVNRGGCYKVPIIAKLVSASEVLLCGTQEALPQESPSKAEREARVHGRDTMRKSMDMSHQ